MRAKTAKPTTRQVLTAVVHDSRAELALNNPDYRAVGRMFADALEAIDGAVGAAGTVLGAEYADRLPAEPEVRAGQPPEVRARAKTAKTARTTRTGP